MASSKKDRSLKIVVLVVGILLSIIAYQQRQLSTTVHENNRIIWEKMDRVVALFLHEEDKLQKEMADIRCSQQTFSERQGRLEGRFDTLHGEGKK